MGNELGCNNIRNMDTGQFLKTNYMMWVNVSKRRPFIFIFRLNIVLYNSHHADENVMKIQNWKQKLPDDCVRSFSRVLLNVLETLILS